MWSYCYADKVKEICNLEATVLSRGSQYQIPLVEVFDVSLVAYVSLRSIGGDVWACKRTEEIQSSNVHAQSNVRTHGINRKSRTQQVCNEKVHNIHTKDRVFEIYPCQILALVSKAEEVYVTR